MPERMAIRGGAKARRLASPYAEGCAADAAGSGGSSSSSNASPNRRGAGAARAGAGDSAAEMRAAAEIKFRLAHIPQDLLVLIIRYIGPGGVLRLALTARRTRDLGLREEVWRGFCEERWGHCSNFHAYRHPKDLFMDQNGWFPQRCGRRLYTHFELEHIRLHDPPCLTMDLRITDKEIVAVSEAPRGGLRPRKASLQIIDPVTRMLRERFEVSDATVNCCDVGPGLICLGSDDCKVRLYRRDGYVAGNGGYRAAGEFTCSSEVNDLRYAREDAVLAVRTHQNRHPAGLDLIPLARPDGRVSFQGGSWATRGKYIHALDGFEDGCTLSGVACSGEHPLTSAFSAMLFDFRRPAPCVVDLPVTSVRQGHPLGTMLWPLRAGRPPQVFANLLHDEDRGQGRGTIAMVDFRYPTMLDVCTRIRLPQPVDDFRCFEGNIYAACTESVSSRQRVRILRCVPGFSACAAETLCTVAEAYDAGGRSPREDLKVFSICQRGFATSYGEHLALGSISQPPSAEDAWDLSEQWKPKPVDARVEAAATARPRSPCCEVEVEAASTPATQALTTAHCAGDAVPSVLPRLTEEIRCQRQFR